MAVAFRSHGQGPVGLDRYGNVVRLRGERFGEEVAGADYVGVAAVGQRVLCGLPARGCLIGDVALPELRAGRSIPTLTVDQWHDAGDLPGYLSANLSWLARHAPSGAWNGQGARVDPGIRLEQSVIGAGATLTGRGRLRRVVVWPGATARAPLEDAVVTTKGRVVPVKLAPEAQGE